MLSLSIDFRMLAMVALGATAISPEPMRAQSGDHRLEIDGFGGWTFGKTNRNRFLGADPDGNYRKGNFALKVSGFDVRSLAAVSIAMLTMADAPGLAAQTPGPLAVVANRDNPITGLSLEELRRLYLGATTIFANKERVILLEYRPAAERFYQAALAMSDDRVRRHWIRRVFAGEVGTPPDGYQSSDELTSYVSAHPGAIAFVPADNVGTKVKLIPVEGKRPGDPGYRLQ